MKDQPKNCTRTILVQALRSKKYESMAVEANVENQEHSMNSTITLSSHQRNEGNSAHLSASKFPVLGKRSKTIRHASSIVRDA